MRSQIEKWGDSLAIRIPELVANQYGLYEGLEVEFSVEDGRLIVLSITFREARLQELVDRITPDNVHPEVKTGPPLGNEAW
jgi:antitoxin MazE